MRGRGRAVQAWPNRHLSFSLLNSTLWKGPTAFPESAQKRTRFFSELLSIFSQVALSLCK